MAFALPFVLGILIMFGMWIFDNFPTWVDWQWLKQGGGFLSDKGHIRRLTNSMPARKSCSGC